MVPEVLPQQLLRRVVARLGTELGMVVQIGLRQLGGSI